VGISTHILDTALGRPAEGVAVTLEARRDGEWVAVGNAESDADGRVRSLVPAGREIAAGMHRLRFDASGYFARSGRETFYPFVEIAFVVRDPEEHHHVPLLLAPYGFSTYRGS